MPRIRAAEPLPALAKTRGDGVLREIQPGADRSREPVEKLLGQITRLDRLGELLRDFSFGEEDLDIHNVTTLISVVFCRHWNLLTDRSLVLAKRGFPCAPVLARIDFVMRVARSICAFAVLAWQSAAAAPLAVTGRVVDENGVAIAGARVGLSSGAIAVTAISDTAGSFNLEVPSAEVPSPGEYQIR